MPPETTPITATRIASDATDAPTTDFDTRKVLIVDDDPLAHDLLTRHLLAAGYEVLHAAGGVAALDLLAEHRPRIVIADWEMPGVNGPQLCRVLRQREPDLGFVYVIMLTVHTDKARLVHAFDAGVDDFLTKPFDGGELIARLRAGRRVLQLEAQLRARIREAEEMTHRMGVLNQQLEQLAGTDVLTGLANRRDAMSRLDQMIAMARRYNRPLACAMIDVDDFKRLNDTLGHSAGDDALRGVANVLRAALRQTDVAARIGGEEFLLLLPNQTERDAAMVAERCRTAVAAAPLLTAHPKHRLTISLGVANLTPQTATADQLLHAVDTALYDAKRAGKNRVVLAPIAA